MSAVVEIHDLLKCKEKMNKETLFFTMSFGKEVIIFESIWLFTTDCNMRMKYGLTLFVLCVG
jgi:hypothetical protein